MGLTLTELIDTGGGGTHTAAGLATGGSVKAIIPPSTIYDAGGLAIARWLLDALVAAQAANSGTSPNVIRRTSSEANGILTTQYTVTLTAPVSGVASGLAINTVDNFS